ncbi:MAG TPA: protein kinase [Baekduia sp.]|nr:protein kinase [Baekduia sp.]
MAVSLTAGTILDERYRLDERIGAGGMSTVFRAFDLVLERDVAIKVLHRDIAQHSDQLERFRREARAVAQLNHPHVVTVIDAGDEATQEDPYIVFEHVAGQTLKELIQAQGRLEIGDAVAYAIEIARALGAAHAHGIIHRDVKPQNVMIDLHGSAKVTDFGIARNTAHDGLTADGRVLGTTDYVSPEQALGQDVSGASDIYSLGIVLFEMLTGDVPFHGQSEVSIAIRHVREQLPDVQSLRPEISSALAAVVDHATAKDLAARYKNTDELIADLEDVLAVETARSGQATGEAAAVLRTLPDSKKRIVPSGILHPARAIIVLSAVVLVVIVVLIFAGGRAERGTTQRPQGTAVSGLNPVSIGQGASHSFDPDGDGREHGDKTQLAIDDDPATSWSTETYRSFTKPGVGLYLDAAPGVRARALQIRTPTPDFKAEIYATASGPPDALSGWTKLAPEREVKSIDKIQLDGAERYRYYMVWITALPPGRSKVEISELVLFD